MVRRFLIKVLVCAIAVWAADYLLAGFEVYGGYLSYLTAGLLLAALNTFVRPILKLLSFPLILMTFGVFTFLINAGILWFVSEAFNRIALSGLWSLMLATLIISVVTMLFAPATDK